MAYNYKFKNHNSKLKDMIRAVCFNRKAFNWDMLQHICSQIGCRFQGYLTDAAVINCIESFPDGSIYLSHVSSVNKRMVNCHSDIDKFITINTRYGRK